MFHKEAKLLGKEQADGLYAKQEEGWMEYWRYQRSLLEES